MATPKHAEELLSKALAAFQKLRMDGLDKNSDEAQGRAHEASAFFDDAVEEGTQLKGKALQSFYAKMGITSGEIQKSERARLEGRTEVEDEEGEDEAESTGGKSSARASIKSQMYSSMAQPPSVDQ